MDFVNTKTTKDRSRARSKNRQETQSQIYPSVLTMTATQCRVRVAFSMLMFHVFLFQELEPQPTNRILRALLYTRNARRRILHSCVSNLRFLMCESSFRRFMKYFNEVNARIIAKNTTLCRQILSPVIRERIYVGLLLTLG